MQTQQPINLLMNSRCLPSHSDRRQRTAGTEVKGGAASVSRVTRKQCYITWMWCEEERDVLIYKVSGGKGRAKIGCVVFTWLWPFSAEWKLELFIGFESMQQYSWMHTISILLQRVVTRLAYYNEIFCLPACHVTINWHQITMNVWMCC